MELKDHTIQFRDIRLSLADVVNISRRLEEAVQNYADRKLAALVCPPDKTDEEFEADKNDIRNRAFKVTATIKGESGESVYGEAPKIFASPNLPAVITEIFLTNNTAYHLASGQNCPDRFSLLLDFRRPPLVDLNNPVSAPTSNASHLQVECAEDAFAGEVMQRLTAITNQRKVNRASLHRGFVYDLALWFVWVPVLALLGQNYGALTLNQLEIEEPVIRTVSYVWFFGVGIILFRVLFGYTKWAFPTVELSDHAEPTQKHRRLWYALSTGLLVAFVASLVFSP